MGEQPVANGKVDGDTLTMTVEGGPIPTPMEMTATNVPAEKKEAPDGSLHRGDFVKAMRAAAHLCDELSRAPLARPERFRGTFDRARGNSRRRSRSAPQETC